MADELAVAIAVCDKSKTRAKKGVDQTERINWPTNSQAGIRNTPASDVDTMT